MAPQHTVRVTFGFCLDKFDQRTTLVGVVGVIRCRSTVFENHMIFMALIPQKDAWEFETKIDFDVPFATQICRIVLFASPDPT